jgi:F-type H+-transporting ATPase subunit b
MELKRHLKGVIGRFGFLLIAATVIFAVPEGCAAFVASPATTATSTPTLYSSALQTQSEEKKATEEAPAASPGFGKQLAEASKEAAGEEENAQFKQSPTVRWLANLLGISPRGMFWLAYLINFAVIIALVVWFWRSSLPGMFRNRTSQIRKAMDEAQRASTDANQRLGVIESRLSRLDTEIQAMHQQAEQDAIAEEVRIREAAAEDARKIIASAEQEIAAVAKVAQRELKTYAAELAISLARRQITVDAHSDEALVRTFAEELGAENGNSIPAGKDGHR